MTNWQPIESAPTDGTPILVTVAGGAYHASKAHWDGRWKAWAVTDATKHKLELTPTHWLPLPEPPSDDRPGGRRMTRVTRTILIHFEPPPIPDRGFDYVALFEGEEERHGYGYGGTPQEALQDLIDQQEEA